MNLVLYFECKITAWCIFFLFSCFFGTISIVHFFKIDICLLKSAALSLLDSRLLNYTGCKQVCQHCRYSNSRLFLTSILNREVSTHMSYLFKRSTYFYYMILVFPSISKKIVCSVNSSVLEVLSIYTTLTWMKSCEYGVNEKLFF